MRGYVAEQAGQEGKGVGDVFGRMRINKGVFCV